MYHSYLPAVPIAALCRFLSNSRLACGDFVFNYLQSRLAQREVYHFLKIGAQPALNLADVARFKVLYPPLPEQQKIAAILSTWDRAIELTEKLIAAKEKRKQALMQQLLTGKVRFREFEGKPWVQVRLGNLLKEVKRFVEWDDDVEYHLLSVRRRSGGMFDRESKFGRDILTKVMMTTEQGDFVIARMQAIHGAVRTELKRLAGKSDEIALPSRLFSRCLIPHEGRA